MPVEAPRVDIAPGGYRRAQEPGQWSVSWHLRNLDDEPLRIIDANSPHHGFRAEVTPVNVQVPPFGSTRIDLLVAHQQKAPSVIDNAFLIVRMGRNDSEWRAFYRLIVTFGAEGEPKMEGRLTGVHPVGFSETA